MERLYYEKEIAGSKRAATAGITKGPDITDYLNKVAHLVPSEVIAGYLTMVGFVGSVKSMHLQGIVLWVIFAAGLILTPVYLNNVSTPDKPKRNHLILSTIAFVVWAYVTTGKQLLDTMAPGVFDQALASIILILFSLVSAVIPLDK